MLFATERQMTGTPLVHRAYVYSGNKAIWACAHNHRSSQHAMDCAESRLRKLQGRGTRHSRARLRELQAAVETFLGSEFLASLAHHYNAEEEAAYIEPLRKALAESRRLGERKDETQE